MKERIKIMRSMMKKLVAFLLVFTLISMSIPVSLAFAATTNGTSGKIEISLVAEQNKKVGSVIVEKKSNNVLQATYKLDEKAIKEGWLIYGTHLAIGSSKKELPQNKNGQPVPGQFPYRQTFSTGKQSSSMTIDISYYRSNTLYVAAHATIRKTSAVTTVAAPYGGSKVYAYKQGLRSDGNTIDVYRSDPNNALHYETGMSVSNFYSLGFDVSKNTGWIIIEFDKPITNGPGYDLEVIEDTWISPYVLEEADVYVSNTGKGWKYLGRASNLNKINDIHSSTKFDLASVCMSSAKYVKLQDVSSNEELTDGFDLNAVHALHDYVSVKTEEGNAWAEGTKFSTSSNCGMYFTIELKNTSTCQVFSLIWLICFLLGL
jgi:hypothetical protein